MHMGGDGWNLAAMLRSLDLMGITKAREVARPSERLRSVFNNYSKDNVKHIQGGWGKDVKRL